MNLPRRYPEEVEEEEEGPVREGRVRLALYRAISQHHGNLPM